MAETAEQLDDEPIRQQTVPLPVGKSAVQFKRGRIVAGVCVRGMRNKPLRLRRLSVADLHRMTAHTRGIPTFYAVDVVKQTIHLWPGAVSDLQIIVEYGDTLEDTGEESQ